MLAPAPVPRPPDKVLDSTVDGLGIVAPAMGLEAWVRAEILAPDRPLSNYDFDLLTEHEATIGFLWCAETELRKGKRTLGTCALGEPTGRAWDQVKKREQLVRWFERVPDFVITIDAHFAAHVLDTDRPADLLAVVEHELYHCGHEVDRYGIPRYGRDGSPIWGVRPHDVEEFAGVVRRYGVGATQAGPLALAIEHVREHGPDVAQATIDGLCGTCRRPLAAAD